MKTITSVMAIGLMALVSATQAANPPASLTMVPEYINYQGRLMTVTNTPYSDGVYDIQVDLWSEAAAGIKLWSEQYSVRTKDGYFSVNLGSGGRKMLGTNSVDLWQAMWGFSDVATRTNTLFMGLTVMTGADGRPLTNPVESTPRQQFLSAPYAFRAHQSVYARKADAVFDAPQGVQTPSIVNTNASGEIALNGDVRVPVGDTIYANKIIPHGASPVMKLHSAGGQMLIGVETFMGNVVDGASSIAMGKSPSSDHQGTAVTISGRSINLNTTNLTVQNQSMFVTKKITAYPNNNNWVSVPHGFNIGTYDVMIVGFETTEATAVKAVFVNGANLYARFYTSDVIGTFYFHCLAIRKGLVDHQ